MTTINVRKGFVRFMMLSSIALWSSCGPDSDTVEPDLGYSYILRPVGFYQVYSVESSNYKDNKISSKIYSLKVTVIDSSLNADKGYTYTLRLQKRLNENEPWKDSATHSLRISDNRAIATEGNIAFVKILFPLTNNSSWDGNSFNTLGGGETCGDNFNCDLYKMEKVGESYTLRSSLSFEKTVRIEQSNQTDSEILYDQRSEIYAKEIGLIFKEVAVLNYCKNEKNEGCTIGIKFVVKGIKYKQTLISYGRE